MKKNIIATVFALVAFVSASQVYAGGGFEDVSLNPDGTIRTTVMTTANEGLLPSGYSNAALAHEEANAGSALSLITTPGGIMIILLIILVLIGLIYLYYDKDTVGIRK